jgi:hypothetical protein
MEKEKNEMFAWTDFNGELDGSVFIKQRYTNEEREELKSCINNIIQNDIRSLIEWIEKQKIETNDLPPDDGGKCKLSLDHTPVWDGNYYTCSKCGKEFVPADWINNQIDKIILYIKTINKKYGDKN